MRGNSVTGYFMMLYPSPGQTGQLTVYYYRQAVPQMNTALPIDTQSGWEDIVYDYAVFKALRASENPTWQQAYQMYNTNLAALIDKSRNMTDQGETITSGIANWPTYTYADNGGW